MRCWLLGVFVSWGGRKGRQEREERRSEEGRSGKKQGRKARKEGNIAPRMELLGGSKMHPKKVPKRLPNLCLEASGRPLASLGALGGAKADFLQILEDFSPNQGQKIAVEAHFQAFSTPEGVQKGAKTAENR